jgi:hypothetical protein
VSSATRSQKPFEIADRLYALPPEEFTAARNQAERELRQAGASGSRQAV